MEPYESLANAIIVQAVKDYREALHFLKWHPHTPDIDAEGAKEDKRKRALREKIIKMKVSAMMLNASSILDGLSHSPIWMVML